MTLFYDAAGEKRYIVNMAGMWICSLNQFAIYLTLKLCLTRAGFRVKENKYGSSTSIFIASYCDHLFMEKWEKKLQKMQLQG